MPGRPKVRTGKGNQVRILSDPVTVSRECPLRIHCTAGYEKEKGMRDDLQVRKPAYYLRRDFRRKLVPVRNVRVYVSVVSAFFRSRHFFMECSMWNVQSGAFRIVQKTWQTVTAFSLPHPSRCFNCEISSPNLSHFGIPDIRHLPTEFLVKSILFGEENGSFSKNK